MKLPTRLQTDAADRLLVRGFVPGHERYRQSLAADEAPKKLQLDFVPLANQLSRIGHGHLAGRSVVELVTSEEPNVRMSADEGGFTIVFLRTGLADPIAAHLAAYGDPLFRMNGRQLGEDFVLRLSTPGAEGLDLRHEILRDPARAEFRTRLEVSSGATDVRIERLRSALRKMTETTRGSCARAFESILRSELDERALLQSLGRDDHAERAALRAALRRMTEVTKERTLQLLSGTRLRAASPLEFELAWTRRTEVQGYLDWLHDFAALVEPDDAGSRAFRGLVAPTWRPSAFDELLHTALRERDRCPVNPRL